MSDRTNAALFDAPPKGKPFQEESQQAAAKPADSAAVTPTTAEIVKTGTNLRDILSGPKFLQAVKDVAPRHLSPERFVKLAVAASARIPKLRLCTAESVLNCLMDLSMYGLEPDGRRAHLIPFENTYKEGNTYKKRMECTLIIDYKGLVDVVRRSGEVSYIHADVICRNDTFSYTYGTGAHLKHAFDMEQVRGVMVGAYSFVKMRDGSEDFLVMPKSEVDAHRARSRAKDKGPWVTDYNEMAKKTVFRSQSKWLPFSYEVRRAIERDDEFTGVTIDNPLFDMELGTATEEAEEAESK